MLDAEGERMTQDFNPERHEFTNRGVVVPSITQVLAFAGIVDFSFVEDEKRLFAMKRGKSVHWLTQLDDEGALNYRKVPKFLRGYRKAWNNWKERSGFVPKVVEKWMISPLGFGGIPDRFGKLGASKAVVELKTGAVAEWTKFQLAAQCVLIEPRISMARTFRRIGVSLQPDGEYKVKEFPLSSFDSDIARFILELRRMQNAGSN